MIYGIIPINFSILIPILLGPFGYWESSSHFCFQSINPNISPSSWDLGNHPNSSKITQISTHLPSSALEVTVEISGPWP